MKTLKYITLAALTLSFAACEQEDITHSIPNDPDAVKINATIGSMHTRVAYGGNGETTFEPDDRIRVINDTRAAKNRRDVIYMTDGYGNWSPVDNANSLVWDGGSANTFYGIYPATASYTEFNLPTDQSDVAELGCADWMTAAAESISRPDNNVLDLYFQHRLTKLTVKVALNDEYGDITNVKIYSKGSQFTAAYGDEDVAITAEDGLVAVTPHQNADATEFTAIVSPVAYEPTDNLMTFTVNGTDHLTVTADKDILTSGLESGKHYTFTLNLSNDVVSIDKVTVVPWDEKEIYGGVAEEIPFVAFSADEEQTMKVECFGDYVLHESLQYSVNGDEWVRLTAGAAITFGGENGTLRLRGKSSKGTAESSSSYARITFGNNDVNVASSGDIRTLVDYTDYRNVSTSEARFAYLFGGCTSLTEAPELPATVLAEYCYSHMFDSCRSLIKSPELPATTLARYCYQGMFGGCTSLTEAPELPATTLADGCYENMFLICENLTEAPELPATVLAEYCYSYMFNSCRSLIKAPELPATTLAEYCYCGMFSRCTSLIKAPELPATTLASSCYWGMFLGCTSLTEVPVLPSTTLADGCYNVMFGGCISLTEAPDLPATTLAQACYSQMFDGCRNLIKAPDLPASTLAQACYSRMFSGCSSLTEAPDLPATTLAQACYSQMFDGCRSLSKAPILPATILADGCYSGMFYGCTSLTEAPDLPATTLADGCYNVMFSGCTSLTEAPVLPATTLTNSCYSGMFYGCTSLTEAPELPATVLAEYCYRNMFSGCTSMTEAPALPATTLARACYRNMFSGCTSLTEAPSLPATTLEIDCYRYMFEGCTSLIKAPELPATTLVDFCYGNMFANCSSLNNVTMLATDIQAYSCLINWLGGVAATGTFVKAAEMTTLPTGEDGIPSGWTVVDYEEQGN